MSGQTEKKLIKDCIKGDRCAQNKLYDLFSAKMFAVCLRYSKTREEAEDTFHEGFMKVYENLEKYRFDGSFEGWIRRIIVNTAIEKFRKNTKMSLVVQYDDHIMENGYFNENEILANINADELMGLIQQLPPYCRIVFNLFAFEGMKHREIAQELGITEGTSKSHLSDARKILQRAVININKPALQLNQNG